MKKDVMSKTSRLGNQKSAATVKIIIINDYINMFQQKNRFLVRLGRKNFITFKNDKIKKKNERIET